MQRTGCVRGARVQRCGTRGLFSYGISLHRGLPRSVRATGVHGDIDKALLYSSTFPLQHPTLSLAVRQKTQKVSLLFRWHSCQQVHDEPRQRWGGVPAQARSGTVVGGVKWCPESTHRSLGLLTDSSLTCRPWSWARCEREAEPD